MAKNRQLESMRKIIPLRIDYADGEVTDFHRHRRHQLIYGTTGLVVVETGTGTWVMPPQRGMWIPAGITHRLRIVGEALTYSLYFEPKTTRRMAKQCQVVALSSFVRVLISEAARLPGESALGMRDRTLMKLVELEARELPHLPLSLPLPTDRRLAQRCQDFLKRPTVHSTLSMWSKALGLSSQTFTRVFRRETGMSFMHWRQQACLIAALPRLSGGESVTEVAMNCGYDNPAAFTSMFKKALGLSPRGYLKQLRQTHLRHVDT